jgi:hypothetical protein
MARDEPGWEDPLMSDLYLTIDVDVKRNDAFFLKLRESDDEEEGLGPSLMTNNPQATSSCAIITHDCNYIVKIVARARLVSH